MKRIKRIAVLLLSLVCIFATIQAITAAENTDDSSNTIKEGVKVEGLDISGMTADEASKAVKKLAKKKAQTKVSLTINKDVVETTLYDLGYRWSNENIIDEASNVGKYGNVIQRYKDNIDLKKEGLEYTIEMELNKKTLTKNMKQVCDKYNIKAKNATLKATGSGFKIVEAKEGCEVDYDTTVDGFYKYVTEQWDGKSEIAFTTTTEITQPKYTTEDCKKVSNTPMGTFYTTFLTGGSYQNRNNNIKNGAEKINGTVLYPGEQFSVNSVLAPWTEDNGWYPAGTYVGGGVEDSLGGGICQVSSTLYNALLNAEIKVVTRFSHSMAVSYVDLAADAALAGDYKDLVFENNTDAPIYVQGIYDAGGFVKFNIYGHDTRDPGHSVKYVSKTISTVPVKTKTTKDSSKPKGYRETVSNGHVGYVAELWKYTYENGEKVNEELLHTSRYAMSPTEVVVGTATADKPSKPDKKEDETKKKSDDDDKKKEPETKKKASDDEE